MPFLVRLQADLLAHEVVSQPEVKLALTNTTRRSDSMDRISRAAESVSQTAAQLPDRISAERKEILAALDQQEGKFRDLASEVNRSLVSANKMSASLTITITNFDALMKRFAWASQARTLRRTPTRPLSTFSTMARSLSKWGPWRRTSILWSVP